MADPIMPLLKEFVIKNADTIEEAWRQKGGWEGWLQVELAIAFKSKYYEYSVQREIMVYDETTQRADLVIMSPERDRKYIIELKTEGQVAGPGAFVSAFAKDLDKVKKGKVKEKYKGATVFAIGIFTPKESFDLAKENNIFTGMDMAEFGIPGTKFTVMYSFRSR